MSEAEVANFLDFTATSDKHTALAFIKGLNGNFEQAVSAYFDDPNPQRFLTNHTWDESHFNSDRGGNRSQVEEVNPESYQLNDDGDGRLHSLAGPSRPNSRASQRANRGSIDMEDADLEKALAMSKNDAMFQKDGMNRLPRQGRAPSPHPTLVSFERAIVPNVEVSVRKREVGQNAFLKPYHEPDLLPGLITILHSIPRCRYALLAKQDTRLNYGENDQWFSGESIEVARTRIAGQDDNQDELMDMVNEVQRLMAFLDKTTRAYGSADALIRLPILNLEDEYSQRQNMPNRQASRFLKTWTKASDLLQSNRNEPLHFVSSSEGGDEDDRVHMLSFSVDDLPRIEEETLYDCIDRAVWRGSEAKGLKTIAPVLIVVIPAKPSNGPQKPMTIPSSALYADRYHINNKDAVLKMHQDMDVDSNKIQEIDRKLAKLEHFEMAARQKSVEASSLLATTVSYFQEKQRSEIVDVASNEGGLSTIDVLVRLEKITTALQERITVLKQEREGVREDIRFTSRLFERPTGGSESKPNMRYHLYGVSTVGKNHAETYTRHNLAPTASVPLEALDKLDDLDNDWQHVSYETQGRDSIAIMIKEMVPESDVLEVAEKVEEGETKMLVYASEEMLNVSGLDVELPDALKDFVNTDNAAFQAEVAQAEEASPLVITGIPVIDEPPQYGPPTYDDRDMNYDGGSDENHIAVPRDILIQNAQSDVPMDSVEGAQHVEHVHEITFGEDDTIMTDDEV